MGDRRDRPEELRRENTGEAGDSGICDGAGDARSDDRRAKFVGKGGGGSLDILAWLERFANDARLLRGKELPGMRGDCDGCGAGNKEGCCDE